MNVLEMNLADLYEWFNEVQVRTGVRPKEFRVSRDEWEYLKSLNVPAWDGVLWGVEVVPEKEHCPLCGTERP